MKKIYFRSVFKLLNLLLAVSLSFYSFNQTVSLDNSFDTDGKVNTSFGIISDGISKMIVQADGKIVVAGYTYYDDFNYDIAVARYNNDGSLDNTFGTGGKVIINVGNKSDHVNEILIQNDGKIILIGHSQNDFTTSLLVVRLNTNGSLDTGFNQTGLINSIFGFQGAQGVCGTFVGSQLMIGGSMVSNNNSFSLLLKLNTDGTPDTSFGTDGIATRIGTGAISEIFIQNNKIIAGSMYQSTSNTDIGLFRFNSDGSIDNSFMPPNNILVMDIGNQQNNILYDLKLCSDGKFIIASHIPDPVTAVNFVLIKFNADATLDTSFGTNGIQINDFSTYSDFSREIFINSDNSFYVAGSSPKQESGGSFFDDFIIVKYNADGTIDPGFGNNGSFLIDFFASGDIGSCIQVQNDGKIVIAGSTSSASLIPEFGLARLSDDQQSSGIIPLPDFNNTVVYPNPVYQGSWLHISIPEQENCHIKLMDLNGKTLFQEYTTAGGFSIPETIKAGSYLLNVQSSETIWNTKVVVRE